MRNHSNRIYSRQAESFIRDSAGKKSTWIVSAGKPEMPAYYKKLKGRQVFCTRAKLIAIKMGKERLNGMLSFYAR
jgi:hypothetical protein